MPKTPLSRAQRALAHLDMLLAHVDVWGTAERTAHIALVRYLLAQDRRERNARSSEDNGHPHHLGECIPRDDAERISRDGP
jgi:hypothetical protein